MLEAPAILRCTGSPLADDPWDRMGGSVTLGIPKAGRITGMNGAFGALTLEVRDGAEAKGSNLRCSVRCLGCIPFKPGSLIMVSETTRKTGGFAIGGRAAGSFDCNVRCGEVDFGI